MKILNILNIEATASDLYTMPFISRWLGRFSMSICQLYMQAIAPLERIVYRMPTVQIGCVDMKQVWADCL